METMTIIKTTSRANGRIEKYVEHFSLLKSILIDVSRKTGIKIELLQSKSREREVVDARFVYFRRAKEIGRFSLARIGREVNKDHATVLHGIYEAKETKPVIELYKRCYEKS